jgi:hypothetical protein
MKWHANRTKHWKLDNSYVSIDIHPNRKHLLIAIADDVNSEKSQELETSDED